MRRTGWTAETVIPYGTGLKHKNKKNMKMNHDITHCDCEECRAKDTCHRYLAHKEIEGSKYEDYCSYIVLDKKIMEEIENKGKCKIYWRHEIG